MEHECRARLLALDPGDHKEIESHDRWGLGGGAYSNAHNLEADTKLGLGSGVHLPPVPETHFA